MFIDPDAKVTAALRGLAVDRSEARRCITAMLRWLNDVTTVDQILDEIRNHPLQDRQLEPGRLERPPRLPRLPGSRAKRAASAVLAERDVVGGHFDSIEQVAAIPEIDEVALAQLIHVGCELQAQLPPGPIVGVMLPLRIETRFYEPSATNPGWTMRLRVIPDAPSIDRHLEVPTSEELDALETMWVNAEADLTTEGGKAQWRRFAAQVGAARGAWLARTFRAQVTGGAISITRPATTRDGLGTSHLSGLPDEIEIWLARGGGAPTMVQTLTVDQQRLALDFPDPTTTETRWWTSFKEAQLVGLGTEIDLGANADDIDVLYAIGIGDVEPATVFSDHRDAGVLAVLPCGTPSNTVAGEPAAELARDPETWLTLLLSPPSQPAAEAVSTALTGKPTAITPLPGGDTDDAFVNGAMVASLWSVLWGHGLKDVWGLGDHAFALGDWAAENLVPEGPLPAIRIGDQPYGVLPVTSLRRWVVQPGDPDVEARLVPIASDARRLLAGAAEAAGNSIGADTDQLLDLVGRVPTSRGYAWRWQIPLENLHAITWGVDGGVAWPNLVAWWDALAAQAVAIGRPPTRRYGTLGWPQDLDLPLVEPDNLPPNVTLADAIVRIATFPPNQFASDGGLRELFPELPNSLLLRLLIHAALVNAAEVARWSKNVHEPMLDPVWFDDKMPPVIAAWGRQYMPSLLGADPPSQQLERGRAATLDLSRFPSSTLERVLRSTLDSAMYRIDPWVTGIAWRRLRSLGRATSAPRFRLGVFGWVDAPQPRSAAAPPDEYFHAPSEAQALTTAILRDRALYDEEPARWQIDIDSDSVRLAKSMADEVRVGSHLSEVVGRAVERAIGDRQKVEWLRQQFPIRTEHAGRRTCDGVDVVQRFTTSPASLALTADQAAALGAIAKALDTYGDLLVADAVHDVVSGRSSLAAASMEAAAGLGAPPSFDVLHTQRSGRAVTSTVIVALAAGAAPAAIDAHTSPGRVAESAVADSLIMLTDSASTTAWTWTVHDEAGVAIGPVSLDDLGLEPIDTLSLTPADLGSIVLEHRPGDHVTPTALDAHLQARRLADILGSQPAAPADLTVDGASPSGAAVQAELLARYTAVYDLALIAQAGLAAAQGSTESDQRTALLDALKWGITPMRADDAPLATRVERAAAALADRIAHAPPVADAANLTLVTLARAMAELVSPGGRLPVLSRIDLGDLPALAAEPPATGVAIDPTWLEVVAAVRVPMARLEAYQRQRELLGVAPFASWSNWPGDPWQTDPGVPTVAGMPATTKLLAIFGPDEVLTPGAAPTRPIALAVLDSWSEVIPSTDQTTSTAFHFDAPGSRAPQAILIAVPPDPTVDLDTATLVDIVVEARELARARAATVEDLDHWSAAVPLTVLPANEPGTVSVDRV